MPSEIDQSSLEQAINAELQPFIGQPVDDALMAEIHQTVLNTFISRFMDDFLIQKADEMGSDFAVLLDTSEGRLIRGLNLKVDNDSETLSTINVDLVLVDEESLT